MSKKKHFMKKMKNVSKYSWNILIEHYLCSQLKASNNLCFVPINHFLLDKS